MQHHIRKMIGLAIAILRGYTVEETILKAFKKDPLDIPKAPGLGLMLEEVCLPFFIFSLNRFCVPTLHFWLVLRFIMKTTINVTVMMEFMKNSIGLKMNLSSLISRKNLF